MLERTVIGERLWSLRVAAEVHLACAWHSRIIHVAEAVPHPIRVTYPHVAHPSPLAAPPKIELDVLIAQELAAGVGTAYSTRSC